MFVDDEIEIPEEFVAKRKDLESVIDGIYINLEILLTTVNISIIFKSCVPLPSSKYKEVYKRLDEVLHCYHKGGYTVTKIHADIEFESLLLNMKDELYIEVNIVNPDEDVGDIERINCTIQEKFRTIYYHLPFKAIPKFMINSLVCVTSHTMILFQVKGGVSVYLSPHVVLGKKQLDYKQYFQYEFVDYVKTSHVNTVINNKSPRTLSSIYLKPGNSM